VCYVPLCTEGEYEDTVPDHCVREFFPLLTSEIDLKKCRCLLVISSTNLYAR
jgi:hypothetical protein